jgi:hypothetical protein
LTAGIKTARRRLYLLSTSRGYIANVRSAQEAVIDLLAKAVCATTSTRGPLDYESKDCCS